MCRHSAELTRRGYLVTSIDLSRSMPLNNQPCEISIGSGVEVVRKDINTLDLQPGSFDLCLSAGIFSRLERDDMDLYLLRQLAGSLKRGGRLLLTAPNAAYLMAREPQLLNPLTRRNQPASNSPIHTNDSQYRQVGQRWYTTLEVNWLLNRVGLRLERFFAVSQNGFHVAEQPGKDSEALGVLAIRP